MPKKPAPKQQKGGGKALAFNKKARDHNWRTGKKEFPIYPVVKKRIEDRGE